MDKGPSTRRGSSASHSTTTSDSSSRKAASIYEIHDLYSALQELVNPSPAIEKRSRKGTGLSFDSSDSWTSGPDSPDVRSRPLQERKNGRVVRSASSITQRYVITNDYSFAVIVDSFKRILYKIPMTDLLRGLLRLIT